MNIWSFPLSLMSFTTSNKTRDWENNIFVSTQTHRRKWSCVICNFLCHFLCHFGLQKVAHWLDKIKIGESEFQRENTGKILLGRKSGEATSNGHSDDFKSCASAISPHRQ